MEVALDTEVKISKALDIEDSALDIKGTIALDTGLARILKKLISYFAIDSSKVTFYFFGTGMLYLGIFIIVSYAFYFKNNLIWKLKKHFEKYRRVLFILL